MEDLSFTQINAYTLEIAKDLKQREQPKGPKIDMNKRGSLADLKNLGITIKKAKHGRR